MKSVKPDYVIPNFSEGKTMENVIEKIAERILTRIESLLIATKDPDRIDALLDKAVKILEIYAKIKGL